MNMVVDLSGALKAALSVDTAARQNAESQLAAFREQNLASYLASLISELNNDTRDADVRQIAGVMLKNTVDAHEEARRKELQAQWVAVDPTLKQHIRDMLLACLHSPVSEVRKIAALAVAKVASIDLPRKEWPNLISTLLNNMGAVPPITGTRQATLMAMGYVCEEVAAVTNQDVLSAAEVSMVLTAVVAGMGPTEPNESRLAATTALSNAVEFAAANFENEAERNYLMQVVCQGTQSSDILIRCASFQCLHEIAAYYYAKLPPYMTELYNITVKAIREDAEEVSLQAIEFWSTVADTELELIEDADPADPCRQFIAAAAPHLVPILLELLTKQEEGQEADESGWNVAMAAGTSLSLIAKVVRDAIVPLVMPFVTTNVSKNTTPEDWRLREAATFAFGSILEGPEPSVLVDIVKQALGFLLQALKDPHPYVKDTTAWTVGRIFEFLHAADIEPAVITKDTLPPVLQVLMEALKDAAHIVYRVCSAIGQLANGFAGAGDTSPMSPFFKDLVGALLQVADAHAGHDHSKVQVAAYEAINDLVRAASRDTLDTVQQLIQVVLNNLQRTLEQAPPGSSAEAREKVAEMQGQLCGMLQVILRRLVEAEDTKAALLPYADPIMDMLLRVLSNRTASVHEEAMQTVGTFTYTLGKNFLKYMPQFYPYLKMGLTNYQEWQVCLSTVGVLGDVCRNIEDGILPYSDEIVSLLLVDLSREDVHRTVKPQILSGLGDLALVTGEKFEKYIEPVHSVLRQALDLCVTMQYSNPEGSDYINELRHGVMDCYSGIMQGLGPALSERYIKPDVPIIVDYACSIGQDNDPDPEVCKVCVNLLGDLCSTVTGVGACLRESGCKDWEKLVQRCQEAGSTMSETEWAINAITHAIRS